MKLACIPALIGMLVGCNAKATDYEEITVTMATTAVTGFSLKANSSVLSNLDSVFFTIDLDNRVIFNADSLPMGTKISRLVTNITFANSMSVAELSFKKDNERDTVVNYLTNPADSIDFTNPVTLNVTAYDGASKASYLLKVNVHKVNPDSLTWDMASVRNLPSKIGNPVAQKTVKVDETVFTLIKENNGEYTLSTTSDLAAGDWTTDEVSMPFEPVIDSFSWSGDRFYIISGEGQLYSSGNAKDWEVTGESGWQTIIGPYIGSVLGVRIDSANGDYVYCCYPENQWIDIDNLKMAEGFPLEGRSALATVETEWSPQPTVFFAAPHMQDGNYDDIWAFDGNGWTVLTENALPPIFSPMLTRYVIYKDTKQAFTQREFDVWLLFGGKISDSEYNDVVYISLDNGISWQEAPESMQLPEEFPMIYGADVVTVYENMSADLSDAWMKLPVKGNVCRLPDFEIDGFVINWSCPFMYVIGGIADNGVLSDTIWRGVLNRLRFTPIF